MKSAKKNAVNISFFIVVVSLIIFFEPQGFKEGAMSNVDIFYKIAKLIVAPLAIMLHIRKPKSNTIFGLLTVFVLVGLIMTIIRSGSIMRFIGPSLTILAMVSIGEYLSNNKKEMDSVATIMCYYFRISFAINILTIVANRSNVFFLGIDNRWVFSYIPWIFFEYIKAKTKHKYSFILAITLSEITLLYRQSVSAMLILPIFYIVDTKPLHALLKKPIVLYLSTIIANYILITIGTNQTIETIVNSLGKDTTFSGRTLLWKNVINHNNYLMSGNGMRSEEYDKWFFSRYYGFEDTDYLKVTHAHNTYMTIIYRYGIFSLLMFVLTVLTAVKRLAESNYAFKGVCIVTVMVCMLLGLFDTIDCAAFYMVLGIASGVNKND